MYQMKLFGFVLLGVFVSGATSANPTTGPIVGPPRGPITPTCTSRILLVCDIQTCSTTGNAFNNAIKAWNGTTNTAAAFSNQQFSSCIARARDDAARQPQPNSTDAAEIIKAEIQLLEPACKNFLDGYVSRKADLQKTGLISLANRDVTTTRSLADELATKIVSFASIDMKSAAQASKTRIGNLFASALAQLV